MRTDKDPNDPATDGLTCAQAARRLKVSPDTVRRWANQGTLAHHRGADNVRYFSPDDIDALVEERDGDADVVSQDPIDGMERWTGRMMQHTETIFRLRFGFVEELRSQNSDLRQELKLTRDRVQTLEGKNLEVVKLFEELQNEKHKRELEWMKIQREERFYDTVERQVTLLGPLVANKIAGKNLLPSGDLRVVAIEELLLTLTDAQKTNLEALLEPAQRAVLSDLIDMARDRRKTEAAARAARPVSVVPDPPQGASG